MNPLTVFPVLVFLRYLPRGILGWDGNGIRVYILNRNVTRREAEDRLGWTGVDNPLLGHCES